MSTYLCTNGSDYLISYVTEWHSPSVVAFTIAIPSVFESPSDPRIPSSLPIQGSVRQTYCPCWNSLYSALHCGPNSSANVPTYQPSSDPRLTQGMQYLGLDECRTRVKRGKQQVHQMFAIFEVARVLSKLGREQTGKTARRLSPYPVIRVNSDSGLTLAMDLAEAVYRR
jgi:hypothetical protein